MRRGSILLCVALFLIAGCSEVPRPKTLNWYFTQPQLESATHWQILAKRTAERLNKLLDEQGFIKQDKSAPSIYIPDADRSPFGVAFRGYLLTELMEINPRFRLTNNPDEPFSLVWEVQLVDRLPHRAKPFWGVPVFIVDVVGMVLMGAPWNTFD